MGESARAHTSSSCPTGIFNFVATALGSVSVSIPLGRPIGTSHNNSTVHSLDATLGLDYAANWSITHQKCPTYSTYYQGCYVKSQVSLSVYAGIVDQVTGTTVASASYPLFDHTSEWYRTRSCYNSICTVTTVIAGPAVGGSTNISSFNFTLGGLYLSSKHNYSLELTVSSATTASAFSAIAWPANAIAAIDLGTPGRGITVSSITLK
ncbi:MAG: hypothetical protein ACHQ2Y_05350 [Candidatus Lutacidiplasmatales archaeon]